jgi:hypothetical protein
MCIVTCTKLQATAHGIAARTSWSCPAQADAGEPGMDQSRTLRRMPQGSREPLLRTLASRCMRACCGRADHTPRRPPRASHVGCRERAVGELRRQGHSMPSRGRERATPGAAPRRGRKDVVCWTEPGRGSAPRRGRGWATTTRPRPGRGLSAMLRAAGRWPRRAAHACRPREHGGIEATPGLGHATRDGESEKKGGGKGEGKGGSPRRR